MDTPRPRSRHLRRYATVLLAAVVAAVGIITVVSTPARAASTLREAAAAKNIVFGTAVAASPLSNEAAYRTVLSREFSSVTAENAMKWDAIQPSNGNFNFAQADALVAYAQQNNQRVYGHTFVWHNQAPSWIQNLSAADLRQELNTHITTVMQRYASTVDTWDVVNEVLDDSGNYRNSFWYQRLGSGYIAEAFRMARAANPNAKLCINDYNIDGQNAKSNAYFTLIQQLKSQGVPIDCIGFQAHLIVGQIPGDMQANFQRFANLGLDVRITELDIRMNTPPDAGKLATQASNYASVVNACLAVSRCTGITVWGFTDRHSWVPGTFPGQGAALLYDDNYNPKPAYNSTLAALGGSPGGPTSSSSSSSSPPPGGSGCRVAYSSNDWNTGFTGSISITNGGSSPINGWTLRFSFTAGQSVVQGWSGVYAQSGSAVTVTNMNYNASIAAGSTVTTGFNGSHSGTNPEPGAFTLNNVSCTVV